MKMFDMSFSIEAGIPCFDAAWHIAPEIHALGHVEQVGRNTSVITLGSHTATHIDAPRHFIDGGTTIDQISMETLCGDVSCVDMRFLRAGECVTEELLKDVKISKRTAFFFGWDCHWRAGDYYIDYPYFTEAAAQYLIESGVGFLAMDTPSPDDSHAKLLTDEDSVIHKLLLQNGVILSEYLCNGDVLDFSKRHQIYALPLKLNACDGAPARVMITELED